MGRAEIQSSGMGIRKKPEDARKQTQKSIIRGRGPLKTEGRDNSLNSPPAKGQQCAGWMIREKVT